MDFWLRDRSEGGVELRLPVAPESVTVEAEAQTNEVRTVELGSFVIPRGRRPARIAWEAIFPGEGRRDLPFVVDWRPPRFYVSTIGSWYAKGRRLRLLVTRPQPDEPQIAEALIDLDVYIERFRQQMRGGMGDCWYSLDLVEARDLVILTTAATAGTGADSRPRSLPTPPSTYVVKEGDSLWLIAQVVLGDGGRWGEIYDLNRELIGPNPDLLQVGLELRMPAGGE